MVSFIYHYNAISIDRLPSKTKIRKGSRCFNNPLYVGRRSPPLQSRFKDNARISSKNSRKYYSFKTEFAFFIKTAKKTTALQQVTG